MSHLARNSDPSTSHQAAAKAQTNETPSMYWARVALEGQRLIDEEIYARAVYFGCPLSPDRIRHGRLQLEQIGAVIPTGRTRKTAKGNCSSREWTLRPAQGQLF